MKNNSDTLIAVIYDKKAPVVKGDGTLPLQVGKALVDLELDMVDDMATPQGISQKYSWYERYTGTYWVWKNTSSEYKGILNCDQVLDFRQKSMYSKTEEYSLVYKDILEFEEIFSELEITSNRIKEILEDNELIISPFSTMLAFGASNVSEYYQNNRMDKYLSILLGIVEKEYPIYFEIAKQICSGERLYCSNIIIAKIDVFDDYSSFLFSVLSKVEESINLYDQDIFSGGISCRWAVLLSNFLTSVFIENKRKLQTNIVELPSLHLMDSMQFFEMKISPLNVLFFNSTKQQEDFSNPLVSIIMAAYNSEKDIMKSLNSITVQTFKNFEVIVIDDGSTDNTLDIVTLLAESDNRIKVISQKNQGQGAARNVGLLNAAGEYICFLDSDDYLDNDFLHTMIENAQKYSSDVVISSHKYFLNETGETFMTSRLPHTLYQGNMNVKTHPDLLMVPCTIWDKLYTKKLLDDINFTSGGGEDIFFWWRAILKAQRVSAVREPKHNYRYNSETSVQTKPYYISTALVNAEKTKQLVKQLGSKEIYEYFQIQQYLLVEYMLTRAKNMMVLDDKYCYEVFETLRDFLKDRVDLSPTMEMKKNYIHANYSLIESISEVKSFEEFKLLVGAFRFKKRKLRMKYWYYKILSKVIFDSKRQEYRYIKKTLKNEYKNL